MILLVTWFQCCRFHSLHHTQFRTNYSLFMPFYDYIYGTMDKSTNELYETSLDREAEVPDVVHLTHLTTPGSIYHLRVGFASLASWPDQSWRWYLWLIWPVTLWSMMVTRIYGRTFVVERHRFNKLKVQTWIIPKYSIQVRFSFLYPPNWFFYLRYWSFCALSLVMFSFVLIIYLIFFLVLHATAKGVHQWSDWESHLGGRWKGDQGLVLGSLEPGKHLTTS